MLSAHRVFSALGLIVGCLTLTACSTIKSRLYDADGVTTSERKVQRLNGIPTTIEVPTHVRITIEETRHFDYGTPEQAKKAELESKKDDATKRQTELKTKVDNAKKDFDEANKVLTTIQSEYTEADKTLKNTQKDLNTAQAKLDDLKQKLDTKPDDETTKAEYTKQVGIVTKLRAESTNSDANRSAVATRLSQQNDVANSASSKYKDLSNKLEAATKAASDFDQNIADLASKPKAPPTPLPITATRSMKYELITQKELYTVDFKRPISGSNDLKLEFGEQSNGQFLKSIGQTTVDTSITDIGDLVEKTSAAIPKLVAITKAVDEAKEAQIKAKGLKGLFGIPGVVAVQCFDIRDPLLDEKIQQFLEQHINSCYPGCPTTTPAQFGSKPVVPMMKNSNNAIAPVSSQIPASYLLNGK